MSPAPSFSCPKSEWNQIWCDPSQDSEVRAENLVSRMTVKEKVQQLQTTHHAPEDPVGSVPRLHLETYTVGECLHGIIASNVTVFPQSVNLAATFDANLLGRVATAIGREVRGRRNAYELNRNLSRNGTDYWDHPPFLVCFAPMMNICNDPRWGRCQESYAGTVLSDLPPFNIFSIFYYPFH